MTKVAISYRRDDSTAVAGRIFDRLRSHYGKGSVFMDIDSIPVGIDFRHHITSILNQCDVLLVVIGPRWRGSKTGKSRLTEPNDWVRIEIETALAKKMLIAPLLIGDTIMPKESQLPDTIRDLAYLQAQKIDAAADFDVHVEKLLRALDDRFGPPAQPAIVVTPEPEPAPPPEPPVPIPQRGDDVTVMLPVALEEVANGGKRRVPLGDGRDIELELPAGLEEDEVIHVDGNGKPGLHGGDAGDLIVAISITPHSRWSRAGKDLKTSITVPYSLAQNGGQVEVSTPTTPVRVSIPSGYSGGKTFEFDGKGLPARGSHGAGKFLVSVGVDAPELKIPAKPPQPDDGLDTWTRPLKWGVGLVVGIVVVVGLIVLSNNKNQTTQPQDTSPANAQATPATGNSSAPAAAPAPATPSASDQAEANAESNAATQAEAQAEAATSAATQADNLKQQAVANVDPIQTKVKTLDVRAPTDKTQTWTYQGEADAQNLPNGDGIKTWPNDADCKSPADNSPPAHKYVGQFAAGWMTGTGVFQRCSGDVYYGNRSNDVADGLGVNMHADGSSYKGQFSGGEPTTGITTYGTGGAIQSDAGQWGKRGLEGYGVRTCSNGNKWKGQWSGGVPSGPSIEYDANWNVLAHGNYGTGQGQTAAPNPTCG